MYEKMNIQWFPGHMTKTRRVMKESLKLVDIVCELLDARIPRASRNPDIDRLAGDKPRLIILNRIDLADPAITARWKRYYEAKGFSVLETDAKSGKGVNGFAPAVRRLLADRALAGQGGTVMLVPEQYTFETEKAMLRLAGLHYFRKNPLQVRPTDFVEWDRRGRLAFVTEFTFDGVCLHCQDSIPQMRPTAG